MQGVSIYNVLRTVAQVQVAQTLSKVDATLVNLPQVKPSPTGQPANPNQSAPQKQTAQHSVAQTQDRVAQTTLNTVKTILNTARPVTSENTPPVSVVPQPVGRAVEQGAIGRPQTPAAQTRENAPTRPLPVPIAQAKSDAPVPTRAITLASLPRPETLARTILPATNGSKPSTPVALKPGVENTVTVTKPADPVLTQLVSQLRQGTLTPPEFVKTVVAQILSGTIKHEVAKQSGPLLQAVVKAVTVDPETAPTAHRPLSNTASAPPSQSLTSSQASTISSTLGLSDSVTRALVQNGATLSQIPTVLSRYDPSSPSLQMAAQNPPIAHSAFPHVLADLAVAQPASLQAIQTALVPQPLKDMSSLVALYAAMIPGWPTAVDRSSKRSAPVPAQLMQLAQAIKSLSPEQQATLFSRMGLPLDVIRVLQQMLRDLDKKLNAKTLETFLAGLLGTMIFVVDEVISFFEDLQEHDAS